MATTFTNIVLRSVITCFLTLAPIVSSLSADDSPYAPLWLYNGTWIVSPKNLAPGAAPDELIDECALIGKYFACQQTVNGKIGALIVFIPADTPGHYYTHAVFPQGGGTGSGDLEITGDQWTYSSKSVEGTVTTYHRTRNTFTGKDHIHFELADSADGVNWTVKSSGDEVRAAKTSKQ